MSAKKYLVILGTRPEVIKMGPVIRALHADARAECVVCLTGQHEELLDSALDLFQIEARHRLHVMVHGQGLGCLTARLLAELERVISAEKPDWVLVQGDTASGLAGSLAAFYAQVPVAHIEAGLRSNEKDQPFPEEVNRRLMDTIATLHFAPTMRDQKALLREGIDPDSIFVCGNTGIDALHYVSSLPLPMDLARRYAMPGKRMILVTAHRRENQGPPMEGICLGLRTVAERYAESVHLVVPVHPNQGVIAPFHRILEDVANVTLCEPLGYQEMIAAARASYFVMTDSGGLQEELPSLGKPALVLRNVTDRAEAVDAGSARLVGTDPQTIVAAATELLENHEQYRQMAVRRPLFGDGKAAQRIVNVLLEPVVRKAELLHFYDRTQLGDTALRVPARHLPRRRSGD